MDFGNTFAKAVRITQEEVSDFNLAADHEDVYITWAAPGIDEDPTDYLISTDIFFTHSRDFGATFEKTINITNSTSYSSGHDLAAIDGSIYVLSDEGRMIEDENGTRWTYSIYFTKSDDNGESFSDGRVIDNSTSTYGQGARIAVSKDGVHDDTFISWTNESPTGQNILLTRSQDGGDTFDKTVQLSHNETFPILIETIAGADGHVYTLWKSHSSDYDHQWFSFVQSSDRGETFAEPVVFNNEVGSDSFPTMAITENGRDIFIVWNGAPINKGDVGGLLGSGLYFTRSDDWGASFGPVIQLNSQKDDFVYQPLVDTNNEDIYVVWNHFWHYGGSDPRFIRLSANLPAFEFGPLDHIYNLTIGNQSYPIRYGFSEGNSTIVESMYANVSSKSITVIINDNSVTTNGNRSLVYFVIELPRNIINANTTEIAGGCSYFAPTNNTIFWKQEHDIDYNIAVTTISEGNTAIYSGNQGESCGPDTRILSIEYPIGGKSMIVIQGTSMIPEFGSSIIVCLTATVSGAIIALSRYRVSK